MLRLAAKRAVKGSRFGFFWFGVHGNFLVKVTLTVKLNLTILSSFA
jgi:hypothetical protein